MHHPSLVLTKSRSVLPLDWVSSKNSGLGQLTICLSSRRQKSFEPCCNKCCPKLEKAGRSHRLLKSYALPKSLHRVEMGNHAHHVGDKKKAGKGVAERWKELAGSNNWKGLLNPLDPDLRNEVIRYGDFCQVTEDGLPYVLRTAHPTGCAYPKHELFEKCGLPNAGYKVKSYLYAYVKGSAVGPLDKFNETNWIGYVAVSDDKETKRLGRRDIVVAWRGTKTALEWLQDCVMDQISPDPSSDAKVSSGFWHIFADFPAQSSQRIFNKQSPAKQVVDAVTSILHDPEYAAGPGGMSITCTGHSLGGALATHSAYYLAKHQVNKHTAKGTIPITAITFASPRVGDTKYRKEFEDLGVKCLRVKVDQDLVPCTPPGDDEQTIPPQEVTKRLAVQSSILQPKDMWYQGMVKTLTDTAGYKGNTSIGTTLSLDFNKSPYLKKPGVLLPDWSNAAAFVDQMIFNHHNLQMYLHLVAGEVDSDGNWKLKVDRNLALINKSADILADEYATTVPAMWWKLENSGIVRNKLGIWESPVRYDPQENNDDYN